MADTLEQRVLGELAGSAQHQARVVANLCRVLAREHELDPALDAAARQGLADLLTAPDDELSTDELTTDGLWRACAEHIDELDEVATHRVLTEIVRGKVAVAKPEYLRPDDQPEAP